MKKIYFIFFSILCYSGQLAAQCTTPVVSNATGPAAICSGETATLTAEADSGVLNWFDSETGDVQLGTGSPFETAALTETTSFWVEANSGPIIEPAVSGGGKIAPTSTAGSTVNPGTGPWGLVFDATQDFLLHSVDVFLTSGTPGTIVIDLKDSNFNVLETVSVAAPAGGSGSNAVQFTVPLNFMIEAGTGYRLVVVSNPAMIRDLSSNSFPYPIGSVGTITQGTINNANTNTGVYYFLYNWNFSPVFQCVSVREEVIVTVNETDLPSGEAMQTFSEGETLADLDIFGENLAWFSDPDGNDPLPDSTPLSDGQTYYVNQTVSGCTSGMLAITVDNPLGVATIEFEALTYYPNPVREQLSISNRAPIQKITTYNNQGKILFEQEIDNTEVNIDFSSYAAGTYFVKMGTANGIKTIKITKN